MPHGHLAELAVDHTLLLGAHVLSDEGHVGVVGPVQLAGLHVFPLGMIDELLGDAFATHEKDTLDLKIGLVLGHADSTEGVLSEAIKSLDETFKHVLEHVHNLAFSADLVVVHEPPAEAVLALLLEHLVDSNTLLVGVVDEESLEVEEIELASLGQFIKRVDDLSLGGLGSSSGGSSLGLLLLNLDDGLHGLGGHLDVTVDSSELGEGRNALKPGTDLSSGLLESLIEDKLEGTREGGGEDDVSDSDAVSNDPVTSEGLVESSAVLLDALDGIVELSLSDVGSAAEDGVEGGHGALEDTGLNPVQP